MVIGWGVTLMVVGDLVKRGGEMQGTICRETSGGGSLGLVAMWNLEVRKDMVLAWWHLL